MSEEQWIEAIQMLEFDVTYRRDRGNGELSATCGLMDLLHALFAPNIKYR